MMTDPVILCVDDEKIVLETLKSQINFIFDDKYQCEIAENADEAWELLEEMNAESNDFRCLLLSDYLMPAMRGDEFLKKVHKKFPQVVNILLTGQMEEEVLEELKEKLPLHCCLAKPWAFEDFSEAVESGINALLKM